eukprot:g4660.t1
MRHYELQIFQLHEFVQTKLMQTDFRALKDECGRLVNEVNQAVIKRASDGGFSSVGGGMMQGPGVYG